MSDFFAYFSISVVISFLLLDVSRAVFGNFNLTRTKHLPEFTLVGLSGLLIWFMLGRTGSIGENSLTISGYIFGVVAAYLLSRHETERRAAIEPKTPNKELLIGVAGWLRFLVIILLYISPLRAFGNTANEVTETERAYPMLVDNTVWENLLMVTWSITSLSILALIYAGICLRSVHHRSSVNIAIGVIWFVGPICGILLQIAADSISGTNAEVGASEVGALFGSALFAATWTAYLLLSKRVANTYG
jgi:hypothetical protein